MPMIIDVHVHYRSDAQLTQALRQAERLDMVLCLNTINLEGTASPHFPSESFVTACNDRTAAGGAGVSAARDSLLVSQSGAYGTAACVELVRQRVSRATMVRRA